MTTLPGTITANTMLQVAADAVPDLGDADMTTPAGTITAPASSVQEQLDLLLQRIRAGNCKLEYADADLLLRNSEDAAVKEVVSSRQHVNRVHPSGSCTFFKRPAAPSASKRPKDDWVECKVSNSFGLNSNKSGQPFRSMAAANEGVVKQSSTIEDKAVRARLQSSISVFSLVALPGGANPNLNPNPNPNLNPNPNPNPNLDPPRP